jgi:hypothetical protein
MRIAVAQTIVAVTVLGASLAASVPGSGAAARPVSLAQAAARTAAQPSLAFDLRAQIETIGRLPYVLTAHGALGRDTSHVTMKVADLHLPDGTVLTGPSAVEQTDGTFLYLRSTVTAPLTGGLWVRERLDALRAGSPELQILRALSPRALLRVLARAHELRRSDGGRVYHGWLPYADPLVSRTLAGLEAGTQYRQLRLTTWVSPQGRVLMVLLSGRTPDRSSTFLLTLTLDAFGKPVAVTPPRQGSFVDFDLDRLSE